MLKIMRVIIITCAAAWLGHVPAQADELSREEKDLIKETFGCVASNGSCIVRWSLGTKIGKTDTLDFIKAAWALFLRRITLVVDGGCYSGCVIGIDYLLHNARIFEERGEGKTSELVCITPRSILGFHEGFRLKDMKKGFVPGNVTFVTVHYMNKDVEEWVQAQGPMPRSRRIEKFKVMPYAVAFTIWPTCGPTQVVTQ